MGPISEKTHNLKIFGPNSLRYNVKRLQKSLFFYFWTWYYKIHMSFWFILPVRNLLFSSSTFKIDPKKIWIINFDDIWSILTIFGRYWPFSQERFPRGLAHCAIWTCSLKSSLCENLWSQMSHWCFFCFSSIFYLMSNQYFSNNHVFRKNNINILAPVFKWVFQSWQRHHFEWQFSCSKERLFYLFVLGLIWWPDLATKKIFLGHPNAQGSELTVLFEHLTSSKWIMIKVFTVLWKGDEMPRQFPTLSKFYFLGCTKPLKSNSFEIG